MGTWHCRALQPAGRRIRRRKPFLEYCLVESHARTNTYLHAHTQLCASAAISHPEGVTALGSNEMAAPPGPPPLPSPARHAPSEGQTITYVWRHTHGVSLHRTLQRRSGQKGERRSHVTTPEGQAFGPNGIASTTFSTAGMRSPCPPCALCPTSCALLQLHTCMRTST